MLIRIESCGECPAKRKPEWQDTMELCFLEDKWLPYDLIIPSWCPLREREVEK